MPVATLFAPDVQAGFPNLATEQSALTVDIGQKRAANGAGVADGTGAGGEGANPANLPFIALPNINHTQRSGLHDHTQPCN